MNVISIQSQVVHGHVGNSAAVLPMQVLGCSVTNVPTTLLSNHPHYPTMRGRVLDSELLTDLLTGVEERGLIQSSDAIISGYLGSIENAHVVAAFLSKAKAIKPELQFVCDPVLGDSDIGTFVDESLAEFYSTYIIPHADIITPNRWEIDHLASVNSKTIDQLLREFHVDRDRRYVIVTGGEIIGSLLNTHVFSREKSWTIECPRLNTRPAGTGDLFTGVLTAQLLKNRDIERAASHAVSAVYSVLRKTSGSEWAEMPIVQSVDEIVSPSEFFPAKMNAHFDYSTLTLEAP